MNISKEWYTNWFGTRFYRLLYKNRNEEEAARFLDLLLKHVPIADGASILDMGCGAGRHAKYLASLGFYVTGIDINEETMILAKQFESEHLKFEKHDIRDPYTRLKFDLIINLFTSFGYFDSESEDKKVVNNVKAALKENGNFVLDYLNAEYILSRLVDYEEFENEGILFKIKRFIKSDFVVKLIEVYDNDQTHFFAERIRMYSFNDFQKLFDGAGMKIVQTFGDYDFNDFVDTESPRIILHCKPK